MHVSRSRRLRSFLLVLMFGWCGTAFAQIGGQEALANEGDAVFLVAQPDFKDPGYRRAVLIAAPIPGGGHVGVIINRSTGRKLIAFFPEHAASRQVDDPVRYGGPYARNALVALVRIDHSLGSGTLPLLSNLYIAFHAATIDKVIETTPNDARYYVGYVGWRPGELNAEIERGLWYVARADRDTVFRKDTTGLWEDLVAQARQIKAGMERPLLGFFEAH